MNGDNKAKTNIGLNLGTLVALLIAIVIGGLVTTDVYQISKRVEEQSIQNGMDVNRTLSQLLAGQQDANTRGNATLFLIHTAIQKIDQNANNTFENQERYFKPFLNQSFEKIYSALNITD